LRKEMVLTNVKFAQIFESKTNISATFINSKEGQIREGKGKKKSDEKYFSPLIANEF